MSVSTLAVRILDMSGIAWLLRPLYAGAGVVVGLHRVLPPGAPHLMPGNVVTTTLLEAMLAFFRRAGYEFASMHELPDRLRRRSGRRFVVFTFDDGYLDSLSHALPVLQAFNAPMTVYCVSGFIERAFIPWWMLLEHLVLTSEEVALYDTRTAGIVSMPCRTHQEKYQAYRRFHGCGYHDASQFTATLVDAFRRAGRSAGSFADEVMLSSAQMCRLSKDPLVTIGCHTVSHRVLTTLPEECVVAELRDSKRYLEQTTGRRIESLAYPAGGWTERECRIAREFGFATAVTTQRGTANRNSDLLAIPRIMPSMAPHANNVRFVRVSAYGIWNQLASISPRSSTRAVGPKRA